MDKEDINKINSKLDRHTDMLSEIKLEVAKEISLIKMAQQKLHHRFIIACIVIPLSVGADKQIIRLLKSLF
jgi:hypothetical protein